MDFPSQGPWGKEMSEAYDALAKDISQTEGLLWKIWIEDSETGRAGGVYMFRDRASLDTYREMHTKRLEGFGIKDIRAMVFKPNVPLSLTTKASFIEQ